MLCSKLQSIQLYNLRAVVFIHIHAHVNVTCDVTLQFYRFIYFFFCFSSACIRNAIQSIASNSIHVRGVIDNFPFVCTYL